MRISEDLWLPLAHFTVITDADYLVCVLISRDAEAVDRVLVAILCETGLSYRL